MNNFVGRARALTEDGFTGALGILAMDQADAAILWSVLAVETGGYGGFLPDRRPVILFERHLFSRYTNGKYDESHPDISNQKPGHYGNLGAAQYDRLLSALELDRSAGLMAASWGLGQVLGSNCIAAGFATPQLMIEAACESETNQLRQMAEFIASNRPMAHSLRAMDWTGLAKRYNGAESDGYDKKLAAAFERISPGPLPDFDIRAVQLYLRFAGLDPGPVDGFIGTKTRSAMAKWTAKQGLPADTDLRAALPLLAEAVS